MYRFPEHVMELIVAHLLAFVKFDQKSLDPAPRPAVWSSYHTYHVLPAFSQIRQKPYQDGRAFAVFEKNMGRTL